MLNNNIQSYGILVFFVFMLMVLFLQEVVARYVSMIPSVSDSVVFPGLCDIWSTCDVSPLEQHVYHIYWKKLYGE